MVSKPKVLGYLCFNSLFMTDSHGSGMVYMYRPMGFRWKIYRSSHGNQLPRCLSQVSIFGDTILVGADRDGLNGKKDTGSNKGFFWVTQGSLNLHILGNEYPFLSA